MTKIDIMMATHNGERYVAEQIESLLWQSFEDWHLYISDDCSEDRTLEILKAYARREPRITVVSGEVCYGSAKANFMHLLKLSKAPYAMFCDQDDVWLPDKIQKTIERMHELETARRENDPLLVLSDMAVVDEELRLTNLSFTKFSKLRPDHSALSQAIVLPLGAGCTFMMNKPLVRLSLEHADVDGMYMHDWWVTLCAATFGGISYIDEPLSLYRQHQDNTCGAPAYSPMRSVAQGEYVNGFLSNVNQARAFRDAYSEMLSPKDLNRLDAFIHAASSDSIAGGVVQLIRSKCWKPWPRSMGQIAAVVRLPRRQKEPRVES